MRAWWVIAASLFAAGTARAAEPRAQTLAVVPIIAGRDPAITPQSIAGAITAATRFRPTIAVVPLEAYYFTEGVVDRVRKCAGDGSCVAEALAPAGVELAVAVALDAGSTRPVVSVLFVGIAEKKTIADSLDEERVTGAALCEAIGARFADMLEENGHPKKSKLVVKVDPPNALITVDGLAADAAAPNTFYVAAGAHAVRAMREGYDGEERMVEAVAGETQTIELALTEDTLWRSPWFWTGTAAAVAAGVAGAFILLSKSETCYCAIDQPGDVCSLCD